MVDPGRDARANESSDEMMRLAVEVARGARHRARPNPWVGAVLRTADGTTFTGATAEPGGPHAEIDALNAARTAGSDTAGAHMWVTLEPCSHTGRTGPCTEAIIAAGVSRVSVGVTDPDRRVDGGGVAALRAAGVEVDVGAGAAEVGEQLAPYLHHRRTGRPMVVVKMAVTLDAKATLPGERRWITGAVARRRVHELRADSDAVVVGIGTALADDPRLDVRDADGPSPRRVVVTRSGRTVPDDAAVRPCTIWNGSLPELLDDLGRTGALQVLVEGGPRLVRAFADAGLVDRWIFHVAPVVTGDPAALPAIAGADPTSPGSSPLVRGTLVSCAVLGDDLELVYAVDSRG